MRAEPVVIVLNRAQANLERKPLIKRMRKALNSNIKADAECKIDTAEHS